MTEEFKRLLEMSDAELVEYFTGYHLKWYQRIQIKIVSHWWNRMRKDNPYIPAFILWESIYKGRF